MRYCIYSLINPLQMEKHSAVRHLVAIVKSFIQLSTIYVHLKETQKNQCPSKTSHYYHFHFSFVVRDTL